MSDSATSGIFGSAVSPRERAAHIACAVVLTVVVLAVIVALVVYFTAGPMGTCDACLNSVVDTTAAHRIVTSAPQGASRAIQRTSADARSDVANAIAGIKNSPLTQGQPIVANKDVTSFQSATGMSDLVNSQNPQGVSVARVQAFTDQLSEFTDKFQTAMASQNPIMNQLQDVPIFHSEYDFGASRGDLSDKYTDANLFAKFMPAWREQGVLRYGQSDAYLQAMANTDSQYHAAPVRPAA